MLNESDTMAEIHSPEGAGADRDHARSGHRHLERARLLRACRHPNVTTCACGDRAARTMEKSYSPRRCHHIDAPEGVRFRRRAAGPRGDGRNLVDNCLQVGAVARRGRGVPQEADPATTRMVHILWMTTGPGFRRSSAAGAARPSADETSRLRVGLSLVLELPASPGGAYARHRPIGGLRRARAAGA